MVLSLVIYFKEKYFLIGILLPHQQQSKVLIKDKEINAASCFLGSQFCTSRNPNFVLFSIPFHYTIHCILTLFHFIIPNIQKSEPQKVETNCCILITFGGLCLCRPLQENRRAIGPTPDAQENLGQYVMMPSFPLCWYMRGSKSNSEK